MEGPKDHGRKTVVVEHLDDELEDWSEVEYLTIGHLCATSDVDFYLTAIKGNIQLPDELAASPNVKVESRSVGDLFDRGKICLLDPAADSELKSEDGQLFDVFLFGGILDRTSELRHLNCARRSLGPVQMTTDTAVRVTLKVIVDRVTLQNIPYVDNPELAINKTESAQMPFRYVADGDGGPLVPQGVLEVLQKDSEKSFAELLGMSPDSRVKILH